MVTLDEATTGEFADEARFKNEKEVEIVVNEQPVRVAQKHATGAQIKGAAIEQGVHIEPNFVVQEELPNGTSQIIGDGDDVKLRDHMRFTAIAPDDNS